MIFFLLFFFIGTEITKFWQYSGILYEKRILSKKLILAFFFGLLCTKPKTKTKSLNTCPFSVLRRNTLKRIQTNQYEEIEQHCQKGIFWEFLIMLPLITLWYMQKTLCLGNERTLGETCIMSLFKFHKYQKAKTSL